MHIKRNIYNELLNWKNTSQGKTALLIEGARRIGKSFIAKHFAENEYKSYIIIDFAIADDSVKKLFDNANNDLNVFFTSLSLIFSTKLHERESLIIFDEVQQYPKARQMIKYLVADGRYDYIETGSLLSIKANVQDIVIPSEEESINMHPISFDEYLIAINEDALLGYIRDRFENLAPIDEAIHRKVMKLFRQYLLIGGMPQALSSFIENGDFEKSEKIKKQILKLYRNDIGKFAGRNKNKVLAIFDEIPSALSKHDKAFRLASLNKSARKRDYEDAFIWLDEAMIVNPSYNINDPNIGLRLNADNSKLKLFMADTGLLISHSFNDKDFIDNELYRNIFLKRLGINEGMLMENVVAQMLRASGHKLFFHSKPKNEKSSAIEVDFLISRKNKICPIEVKSSGYTTHKSLDIFYNKYKSRIGAQYIIYSKDLMIKDDIICLPAYMTFLL